MQLTRLRKLLKTRASQGPSPGLYNQQIAAGRKKLADLLSFLKAIQGAQGMQLHESSLRLA